MTSAAARWAQVFTKQAQKDAKKAKAAGFKPKIESLLAVVATNPYQNPPPYERWWAIWQEPYQGGSISSTAWYTRSWSSR